jgi:hypothetical protein
MKTSHLGFFGFEDREQFGKLFSTTTRQFRQDVFVIVDVTDELRFGVIIWYALDKYTLASEVVRRCIQPDNEITREEVFAPHIVFLVGIDENVCERGGRVAHVGTPMEQAEQFSDLSINFRHFFPSIFRVVLSD